MTGADLVEQLRRRAEELGVTLETFVTPLTDKPGTWLGHLSETKSPRPHTIERVNAMLASQIPPPPPSFTAWPPSPPIPQDRWVKRDPCFKCGIRADIGCRHQPKVT